MPDAGAVEAAIKACPFVVVSDMFAATDTARHADVLLPSLGWGEKDGTVTNSERRISRQRPFLAGVEDAKPDWWQMTEVARRMGFAAAFDYRSSAGIFAEHAALSAFENDGARDFDIGAHSGIGAAGYDALAPFQWPQPTGETSPTPRFFASGRFYHPDGKARFIAVDMPETERRDECYPFTLNTGRIRDQWHTMTRTGRSARLSAHIAEPFAEIHPKDAAKLGIASAALVEIESPQGRAVVRALVTERQMPGNVFAPMHWNDQFAAEARIDKLVPDITDPHSGQPASKNTAVAVRPYRASHYGFAVVADCPGAPEAAYWARARVEGGWRVELAFAEAPQDWSAWCRNAFAIPEDVEPLGYADRHSGDLRLAFFDGDRLRAALFVAQQPVAVARNWAVSQLAVSHDDRRQRLALVAGRPGGDRADPGATVCSCNSIGVNQIVAAIRGGCHDVAAVGRETSAGTNCGSCRAEIGGIIDGCLRAAAE
jgi:assimilatory nitrate reductase catalytic subunit